MACAITILDIIGIIDAPGSAPGRLEVVGTASGCPAVSVTVTRQTTGAVTQPVVATVNATGAWKAVFDAVLGHFEPGAFACAAPADKIRIEATCTDDVGCTASLEPSGLRCVGGVDCPVIKDLTATPGACNADGTRNVTVSATVVPGAVTPVFVEWRHGDAYGASAAFSSIGTFTDTHAYPAGQQDYGVAVIWPEGCAGAMDVVSVEACPAVPGARCPSITFAAPQIGECNKAGERDVTVSAMLELDPPGPVTAELVRLDADGAVSGVIASASGASGSVALSGTTSLGAGMHSIGVRVVSPSDCGLASIPVSVEACPAPCPAASFDPPAVGNCTGEGRRPVTVSARLQPQGPGAIQGRLVLWDTVAQLPLEVLDTGDSFGQQVELSASRDLAPGTYAFVAQVTSPPGCVGSSQSVTVDACPPRDDDDDDDDGQVTNGGGLAINWCAVALFSLLAMLVVGALALGIGICVVGVVVSGPVAVVAGIIAIIGAVLLLLATVGLLIWLYVCGSCRLNCFLVDLLIDVLILLMGTAFVLTVIGGIVAAIGLSSVCWIGWLIDLLDFGFLFIVAYWWARVVGCRPWPRWVPGWARWQLPDAWRITCGRR